jgi:hypothetical protein
VLSFIVDQVTCSELATLRELDLTLSVTPQVTSTDHPRTGPPTVATILRTNGQGQREEEEGH